MLTMSQINHIKDLSNCGYRISEISKKTGADPKTIRKYLAQMISHRSHPLSRRSHPNWIPSSPSVQERLDEDKKHWRKQHHTAQRVYERLVEEHGYTGSYSIVQRYMKKCRSIQTEKANLELIWDPDLHKLILGKLTFMRPGSANSSKRDICSAPTVRSVHFKRCGASSL